MSDDATKWDLQGGAPFVDSDAVVALVEALRRYGAKELEFGYRWNPEWGPDGPDAEAPSGVPVVWFCTVTMQTPPRGYKPKRRERRRTRWTETAECLAAPGGRGHDEALAEAMGQLVRRRGGHVTLVKL